MKLSISNIAWAKEQDEQVYSRMREYGYSALEIAPTRIFPEAPYDHLEEASSWARKLKEEEGFDVILDGYPRDVIQAKYMMQTMADKINGAIVLEVPKEELYERLALRGRDDDKEKASIDRRFKVFEQNIGTILPMLEAKNIPIEHVNGVGKIEDVTARLVEVIKNMNPNATEQLEDVNGGEIEKSYGE